MRERTILFNLDNPSVDKDRIIKYFHEHKGATFKRQEDMAKAINVSQSEVSKFMKKYSNTEFVIGDDSLIIGKFNGLYTRLTTENFEDECKQKLVNNYPFIDSNVYCFNDYVFVYNIIEDKAEFFIKILLDIFGNEAIFDTIHNKNKLYIVIEKNHLSIRDKIKSLPIKIESLKRSHDQAEKKKEEQKQKQEQNQNTQDKDT